jgi:methyl-accepting chemotaxis protein
MHRRSFLILSAFLLGATTKPGIAEQPSSGAFTVDSRVALAMYRALVEEHLTGVLDALRALAATSDAQSADWERIKPALSRLSEDLPTDAAVWFARPDGSYFTTESGLTDQNLKDREYFPELVAGGDIKGSLVISKSTGHRSIVVATPIEKDGQIVAAIGVSVRARLLSALVDKRINLPESVTFYALNPKGQIAIHKDPDQMFKYPSDIGDGTLKTVVSTILSKAQGDVAYDFEGKHMIAIFDTSEVTGWHFVLVIDRN